MSKKKNNKGGYKNPPKHSQFPPGVSGNKKGRPNGSKNFKTIARAVLKSPVKISKNGKKKTISTIYATLLRLREAAIGGNQRAMERLIDLAKTYMPEEIAEEDPSISDQDADIMKVLARRIQNGAVGNSAAEPTPKEPRTNDEDDDSWLY